MKTQHNINTYERALRYIGEIKEFYQHLIVYAIFLIAWLVFKNQIIEFVVTNSSNTDSGFLNWLTINVSLVPILWGIGLIFQFLYLNRFKLSFFKNWEEKKIKELIEKNQS